jgi:hypothetical protein
LYSPTEIVFAVTTIIAAVTTMGVALITAWRTSSKIDVATQKIEQVHEVTNANFNAQKREIDELRAKLDSAYTLAASVEIARAGLAEAARLALAESTKTPTPPGGKP